MRALAGDRTVVMISHRYSGVRFADRILVLDEGRLVESGPHESLLADGGLYERLYRQRIRPAPPWHYYGAAAALLAAPAGTAGGLPALALGGCVLWLALTARFCARRLRGTSHAPGHVAEMALTSALIPLLSVYWRLRGAVRFRVFFL